MEPPTNVSGCASHFICDARAPHASMEPPTNVSGCNQALSLAQIFAGFNGAAHERERMPPSHVCPSPRTPSFNGAAHERERMHALRDESERAATASMEPPTNVSGCKRMPGIYEPEL